MLTFSAGYFLLDPTYRGKHLQKLMWQVSFDMALDVGCPGFLGRMAVTARTPVAAYKAGWQFIGTIPRSLNIPGIGWIFDLVGIRDFMPLMSVEEKEKVCTTLMVMLHLYLEQDIFSLN